MATADGLKSVAFPALGTGYLHFPCNIVAHAMFDEVKTFSTVSPQTSVSSVVFVVFDTDIETLNVSAAVVVLFFCGATCFTCLICLL